MRRLGIALSTTGYDRPEDECEGPIFDKCMSAFSNDGKIQTALATVAKDPSFCE